MAADGEGSNARTRAFAEARKEAKTKTISVDAKKMLTESMANGFDKYMDEVLVARLKTYLSSDCGPLYVAEPVSHLLFEAWAETSLAAHGEGIRCPLRSSQDIKQALANKSLIQTGGSLKNLDMVKRALNLGSIENLLTLLHELLASEPLLSLTTEECLANMPY